MKFICPSFSDMYEPNVEIKNFPDGDSYVKIPGVKEAAGKDVLLLNRLYPNQDSSIFQTLLALKAINAQGPRSITLFAPYLPYSRQDTIFEEGEVKSAEVLCELFRREGVGRLATFDCHFLKKEGDFEYGGLRIRNISLNKEIIAKAKEDAGGPLEIMSPDEGANYLVKDFGGSSMKKERGEYVGGKEAYRGIKGMEMSQDVKGKTVLIIDDMISTGSTMFRAIENVKAGGAAGVVCAATHGFFLRGSLEKLKKEGKVFVSDTIPTEVSEIKIKPFVEGLEKEL